LDINQIAIWLEIFGFFLATIFGAILLAPEASGRFAVRFTEHLFAFGTALNKATSVKLPKYFGQRLLAKLLRSYVSTGALLCLVIGFSKGISTLFWFGVVVLSFDALVIIFFTFISYKYKLWGDLRTTKWLYPFDLVIGLIFSHLLAWLLLSVITLIFLLVKLLQFTADTFITRELPRKICIIVGGISIFIGLILELVATYQ